MSALSGIIDVHQHLIYPERYNYPWTSGIPKLVGRSLRYEEYLRAAEGCGIGSTVFMESGVAEPADQDESGFISSLSTESACPILALIATCRPEREGFERFVDELDRSAVVGLRRILHVEDDGLSRTDRFRENIRLLGTRGLTFDLCFQARQLPLAVELAVACPDVSFVLDHCGVPDVASAESEPWRTDIAALADLPNVACKISGVLAYCDPAHADRAAVTPYVEHCIETFGWDRVVWGSDWPLVEINSSLSDWVTITREIVEGESADKQRKLFTENAQRIYGLKSREAEHV
jgi:predicted TIM-barrel fold metal-dependent hydrolase